MWRYKETKWTKYKNMFKWCIHKW